MTSLRAHVKFTFKFKFEFRALLTILLTISFVFLVRNTHQIMYSLLNGLLCFTTTLPMVIWVLPLALIVI